MTHSNNSAVQHRLPLGTAAMMAGVGRLLIVVSAPFAQIFVFPALLAPGDPAQTASNLMQNRGLFPAGILAWLLNYSADVLVGWALFYFLVPASRTASVLAFAFCLIYTAVGLSGVFNYVEAFRLLDVPKNTIAFGTEAFRIAGRARQQGHDVRVVAAALVRSLGVGQRGLKNGRRDARALSEASCRIELPSVHIPSVVSQEVKAICVSREALIKTRTQLVSRVRSYVRSRLGAPLRATPESLPGKVRHALVTDAEGLPAHLDRLLVVLEVLSGQIADADVELKELAANDERMQRLMTVPGVGPVTAARFVAAIDQVDRFPDASSVASYLGLIPGEKTTGFRTRRRRLTRAGAPQVRWALGQAA